MNEALGILGLAVLAIVFGLMNRKGHQDRCGSCGLKSDGHDCNMCELLHEQSETSHGTG
ncbi:MAG: hypothetical protein OEO20_11830 [Gemmatimonadota bacterium]|nr:hypothetical protein [Gemmatimonadota bacterium]MDH3368183.1 hypothetical protein [Gemmatimonadota bacterium]MDH3478984.1 hypothetical protein [Gemmatimonadota bacterium]MDH3568896.1 hypothetical protein [Gemmatimonadota bacterium]MDH5549681.1 hypothetical protein [Gemmatimonadota bacterium]